MFDLAKNRISSCELGKPVMVKEVVGRIVGYNDEGSWGELNGTKIYSILDISTPHGTIIKSGCIFVDEITSEGLQRLEDYEEELRSELKPLYNNKLDGILPRDSETYIAKLRNSLTPLYSLAQMFLLLEQEPDKKDELLPLVIETAKNAENLKDRIDKLLKLIENT